MAGLDLKEYARRGAEVRVRELLAELTNIYKTFPDLRKRTAMEPGRGSEVASRRATASEGGVGVGNGRKPMSAAQRRAVSLRMKRYWAERRKSQ